MGVAKCQFGLNYFYRETNKVNVKSHSSKRKTLSEVFSGTNPPVEATSPSQKQDLFVPAAQRKRSPSPPSRPRRGHGQTSHIDVSPSVGCQANSLVCVFMRGLGGPGRAPSLASDPS